MSFYYSFYSIVNEGIYYINTETPKLDLVQKWCERNLSQNLLHLVVMERNTLIGSCDIYSRQFEGAPHIGVMAVFVIKEHRGRGIASNLISAILTRAKTRGIEKLELEVLASNEGAINCYEKFGFVHEGTRKNAKKMQDGSYSDVILMAKFL
ncbi:GNAT family N-acetyltransferase [Vibrio profundum]